MLLLLPATMNIASVAACASAGFEAVLVSLQLFLSLLLQLLLLLLHNNNCCNDCCCFLLLLLLLVMVLTLLLPMLLLLLLPASCCLQCSLAGNKSPTTVMTR